MGSSTQGRILLQLLLSFLLYHGCSHASYTPTDSILINCGASGDATSEEDGREWVGDIASRFTPSGETKSFQALGTRLQRGLVQPIPYKTARLSHSAFAYRLPISGPGPRFIRLHFFPTTYGDGGSTFNRSRAIFSVRANQYTLLDNFSASLNAYSMKNISFYKEFTINVGSRHPLILTFSPSPQGYAFINGIELVSIPFQLYYAPPREIVGLTLVGGPQNVNVRDLINNFTAFETVHRVTMGGGYISPKYDSGLFRSWSNDSFHRINLGWLPAQPNVGIKYTKVPDYTAPPNVYSTAITMSEKEARNKRFNVTWQFPVDRGFSYLLRLHFCEYQAEMRARGGRPFIIFINDQLAENSADVLEWSGGNSIAVYRDFYVRVPKESDDTSKHIVFVDIHPKVKPRSYSYVSAILNGAEMFKLSDSGNNLAGLNPIPDFDIQIPMITIKLENLTVGEQF